MVFGDMAAEVAKERVHDLRREGCALRRYPAAATEQAPAAPGWFRRVGCLLAEVRA